MTSLECFSGLLDALDDQESASRDRYSINGRHAHEIRSHNRKQQQYNRLIERRRMARRNERQRRRSKQSTNVIIQKPLRFTLQIYIDFGFSKFMSDKEIGKLVRQMGRIWGIQKRSAGLEVTLLAPDERFLSTARQKLTGFDNFRWIISDKNINEISTECELVYLSPDSQCSALLDVKPEEIYVLGGLVDETGAGSLSRCKAEQIGIRTQRLPIQEFLKRRENGTFNVMLTINQVVEILVHYVYSGNWVTALSLVPKRIGYEVVG